MGRKSKGTVRLRGEKWHARIMIQGEVHSATFDHEDDAHDFIAALIELHKTNAKPPTTLLDLGREWFLDRERGGIRNVRKERSRWRAHIIPWPKASAPVKSLRTEHVQEYVHTLVDSGLSRQSVVHVLAMIRGVLRWAVQRGKIRHNVAENAAVPRMMPGPAPQDPALSQEEIDRVLALEYPKADGVERRAIFAVAIYTGLRKSEIWWLRWEHVHLEGPDPRLNVTGPLKTEFARREVPLLPPVRDALAAWRARDGVTRATGLVFPKRARTRPGEPPQPERMHDEYFDAGWRDQRYRTARGELKVRPGVKTRARLGRHVVFHHLRHTCASHLASGSWGVALDAPHLTRWMGWSSIKLADRYVHLMPGGIRDRARQMAESMTSKASRDEVDAPNQGREDSDAPGSR